MNNKNRKRLIKSLNKFRNDLIEDLRKFRQFSVNRKRMDQSYFSKTCNKFKLEIKELDNLIEKEKSMKEKSIFELRPQYSDPKFGPEPSIRMLIQRYYEEYFPVDHEEKTKAYLMKLKGMYDGE